MNELARLSRENNELRAASGRNVETFSGLSFEELVHHLSEHKVSAQDLVYASADPRWRSQQSKATNLMDVFIDVFDKLKGGALASANNSILDDLGTFGLVERESNRISLTADGRRFPKSAFN